MDRKEGADGKGIRKRGWGGLINQIKEGVKDVKGNERMNE